MMHRFRSLGGRGLWAALAGLLCTSPASGQSCFHGQCTFSTCHTPAFGVASSLWGELEPTDLGALPINRDTTYFDQVGDFEPNPLWMSLDVESGWVFAVPGRRFQIWNATSNPAQPSLFFDLGFRGMGLTWTADAHAFYIFDDVDAPPGFANVAALVGRYGMGMAVFDTTSKANPVLKYQDHGNGRWASQVYASTVAGVHYAFVAAYQGNGGLYAYSLSAARALSGRCTDAQPAGSSPCPGVYLGKIGSRNTVNYVDGAGSFVIASSGLSVKGFEIWNVSNPSSPMLVMNGLPTVAIYAVAMWQNGSNTYAALRTSSDLRIYDVSCVANGPCTLGSPLWTKTLTLGSNSLLTTSRSSSTPFLYVGTTGTCQEGTQNEFLYDVSSPSAPRDITPPGTVGGVSYWGWYYRRNGTNGFNYFAPRMGKFGGQYFYRAAHTIFDVHRWTAGIAPQANFSWTPGQIYPGTPVNFTDQSSGVPSTWSWDFLPDGSPASSTAENPSGVEFATVGSKTVTLEVSNVAGSTSMSQPLQVLDPQPAVASVSAAPSPALACQPVTFDAQGVTGRPPLTFSWTVRQVGGGTVATGGNVDPFVWTSASSAVTGVAYTAEVTVSNGDGSILQSSPPVLLLGLDPLPPAGGFAASYDGQPDPPAAATVQFHVAAAGATEWNWDFGDDPGGGPEGDGYQGWTSDPVAGPNPQHTYAGIDTFSVRVKVRNCLESERESSPVEVEIVDTTPLAAQFTANLFCQAGTCFGDEGEAIAFNDMSVGSPDFWDYDWDGDGTFEQLGSASPIASHTFTEADVYFPTLRVRRGANQDLYEEHLAVNIGGATPSPAIEVAGPSSGAPDATVTLHASADDCRGLANGWTWTTSGGSGSSTTSTLEASWSEPGIKTVTAMNTGCNGVTGTATVQIMVGEAMFADGFESGDTSAWTAVVPAP